MTAFRGRAGAPVEVPVLSYTQIQPALREEYGNGTLVHFIPQSLWTAVSDKMEDAENTTYLRILAAAEPDFNTLNILEKQIVSLVGQSYDIESENRIQEKLSNDQMITGSMMITGAFCGLLAIIGIANIFANTFSFLRQRKREFAQYMSVGLTPAEMRSMFCIEALVIAGRPLLITLPLTVSAVTFMIAASHLEPWVFWAEAPVLPVMVFALMIAGFVALAYYLGGKRLLQCDLSEELRDDT